MRILITGITGNLGNAALNYFENIDWEIDGVSRSVPHRRICRNKRMITTFPLQLTNWEDVDKYVQSRDGGYDIVFMTHGTQEKVFVHEFDDLTWNYIVGNNLKSAAILSQALVKYDKINEGGLIVYCSSIQATQPRAGRGLYALAKGGLESLMKAVAVELAPKGRAIALRLGQMTGQMQGIVFPEVEQAKIARMTPLPWVSFHETAQLVLNLYRQPSLSGEVLEISSMHKYSIWP